MEKINIRFIPLILGAYIGVGLLMTIDAWVSVSLIDKNNPSTWPEMHPWVRIYCIPLLGTVLAFIALIIEFIRSNIWKTNLASFISWIVLGLSYTTFLSTISVASLHVLAPRETFLKAMLFSIASLASAIARATT